MKYHSHGVNSEKESTQVNDLFGDDFVRKSKTERKSEKKKQKQSFRSLIQQGRYEDLEDLDDYWHNG